jgi:hypothetical protein
MARFKPGAQARQETARTGRVRLVLMWLAADIVKRIATTRAGRSSGGHVKHGRRPIASAGLDHPERHAPHDEGSVVVR